MAGLQTDHAAGLLPLEPIRPQTPPATGPPRSPSFDEHLRRADRAASSPEEPPPRRPSDSDTAAGTQPPDSQANRSDPQDDRADEAGSQGPDHAEVSGHQTQPPTSSPDEPPDKKDDARQKDKKGLAADGSPTLPGPQPQTVPVEATPDVGDRPADAAAEEIVAMQEESDSPPRPSPNTANLDVENTSTVTPEAPESPADAVAPTKPPGTAVDAAAASGDGDTTATRTPATEPSTTGPLDAEPAEPAARRSRKTNKTDRPHEPGEKTQASPQPPAEPAPQQPLEAALPELPAATDKKNLRGRTTENRSAGESPRIDPAGPAKEPSGTTSSAERAPADQAPRTEQAQRIRFVQRVARAFASAGNRGGSVRLRLSPPELGSLRLEMTVRDGVLVARVETETHAARQMLLDNLPALRQRLAGHDVKVERFQVDVSGGWDRDTSPGPEDQHRWHNRHEPPAAPAGERDESVGPQRTAPAAPRRVNLSSRLDVII